MANDITNLPNSFIKFCDSRVPDSCNDYSGIALPIKYGSELQFMFQIDDTDTTYLDTLKLYLIKGDYAEAAVVSAGDLILELNYGYVNIATGSYIVYCGSEDCTVNDLADQTNHPAAGECVSLVLLVDSTKTIVCNSIQKFIYSSDTCWTQIIRYRCADNSYGFYYEEVDTDLTGSFYNQIRLPLTIHSPVPVTKKTGFRLSDGSYRTLAASKEKEWSIESDWMDDHLHQCLDAAIDHDELYIFPEVVNTCPYTDYEFFHDQDDKYAIDWQEKPGQHLGIAKANFKLKTNPYYSQTSNC